MKLRIISRFIFAVTISTLVAALFGNIPGNAKIAQAKANHAPSNTAQQYGALPMSFIANAGQVDPAVRFQVRGSGGTLSFENNGVALTLNPSPQGRGTSQTAFSALPSAFPSHLDGRPMLPSPLGEGPGVRASVAIHLTFDGANPNTHIGGADQLPGIANFFIGNDPNQWHTNVLTYGGVVYRDLYPGVDLQYGGHPGLLKGTYTLAAGVDPSLIRWRYDGADDVSLDSSTGDLIIHAPGDVMLTEQAPIAWQTRADGTQTPVTVGYAVNSDGSVQFAPAAYDRALPLVIDPGLVYSTYLGGSGSDSGYGITVDGGGNIYVTGSTASANFPTTPAVQTILGGNSDVFVSKLNASGSALVYSTYLGASGSDWGTGITVDSNGNAYVTGQTYSTNFPATPGAFQTTLHGSNANAFVSKLNTSGSTLVYSTYLGGSSIDWGTGIALDGSNNAYVTGYTASADFPTTSDALQASFGGGYDAFVSKLNTNGSALIYSTYLGGSSYDYGYEIAVDGSGSAYVTGSTGSSNFPTTSGVLQTSFGGGYDAFVSKLNANGSALMYSTYLGTSGARHGIALDNSRNAYITGYTTSSNFPTTNGAFQITYGESGDAFVSKLNAVGSALVYSTYLGGSGNDAGQGIAVDSSGNSYITGWTSSSDFPTTSGAFQTSLDSGYSYNAFVSKLNVSGNALMYSTYLGGSGADYGYGIAVDGSSNAYITGYTTSSNFPTSGALQTVFGGSDDAFVSKLDLIPIPHIDTIGIFRSGTFYLRLHNSAGYADLSAAFNPASKSYPVVGDWAGGGFDTVGVFDQNNGLFSLRNSNTPGTADEQFVLGNPNDMPLSGKWLMNATHFGVGVFRPSNGLIYLKNNLTTGYADDTMVLGIPGDQGLAGDWNGDGLDSPGVYRASNQHFYLSDQVCNCSVTGSYAFQYGVSGDAPVVGDWIGQGHDGVGLFRQSNGFTYLRNSLTTGYADISFTYGIAGDVPVAGHWQLTYPPQPNPGSVLVPATAAPVPTLSSPGNGLSD